MGALTSGNYEARGARFIADTADLEGVLDRRLGAAVGGQREVGTPRVDDNELRYTARHPLGPEFFTGGGRHSA